MDEDHERPVALTLSLPEIEDVPRVRSVGDIRMSRRDASALCPFRREAYPSPGETGFGKSDRLVPTEDAIAIGVSRGESREEEPQLILIRLFQHLNEIRRDLLRGRVHPDHPHREKKSEGEESGCLHKRKRVARQRTLHSSPRGAVCLSSPSGKRARRDRRGR